MYNKADIDIEEERIMGLDKIGKYNDYHIIAIVVVTTCRLICTADNNLKKLAKDRRFYPNKFKLQTFRCLSISFRN